MDKTTDRLSKHRTLFKASTPPWKETYRKRCMDRLKQSRDKLKERFRSISSLTPEEKQDAFIKELMEDELRSMQREEASHVKGQTIDSVLLLMEDIQRELKLEEQNILAEYEQLERYTESALCHAVEKLSTDEVICPMCKRNSLILNKSVIFCNCGLRINTEQDCITLSNVKFQLESGLQQHARLCQHEPMFAMMSDFGVSNLLMTCQICDFMFIVI